MVGKDEGQKPPASGIKKPGEAKSDVPGPGGVAGNGPVQIKPGPKPAAAPAAPAGPAKPVLKPGGGPAAAPGGPAPAKPVVRPASGAQPVVAPPAGMKKPAAAQPSPPAAGKMPDFHMPSGGPPPPGDGGKGVLITGIIAIVLLLFAGAVLGSYAAEKPLPGMINTLVDKFRKYPAGGDSASRAPRSSPRRGRESRSRTETEAASPDDFGE